MSYYIIDIDMLIDKHPFTHLYYKKSMGKSMSRPTHLPQRGNGRCHMVAR